MRKIRVICSDPYATDYSSDDEEPIGAKEPANGKLFVQEISVSNLTSDSGTFSVQNGMEKVLMAQNGHSDASGSSREDGTAKDGPICIDREIDGAVSENNGNLKMAKHPGLRMAESGKLGVQVSHPIEGTKVGFGSYDTIEEAMVVRKKKKIKLAMLNELIVKNDVLAAKNKITRRRERLVVDDMTVLETTSGKWAAWSSDKVSNVKTWLGLYDTREEAVESHSRRKLELDSNTAHDVASPIDAGVASFRRPGIKLTKMGRWGVMIQHPSMDSRHWLGSYDTPEEAAEVYDKKKIELEAESSGSHGGKIGTTAGVGNEESCVVEKVMSARGAFTEVIDSQGLRVRYKGVRLRQSGRWSAEFRDPSKRKKIHLGTFDTPEEAVHVYNKNKLQYEARMSRGKKRKLTGGAEADTDRLASETVGVIPEAVDIGVVIKTEPHNASPSLTSEAENSTVTAVSGQDSEESNTNNHSQIPGSSLENEDEYGFGVINCYGQYVGEYSRMDDELWII